MDLINKKELSILGIKTDVEFFKDHDTSDNAMGRSLIKLSKIRICEDMPIDMQEQTLLHEVIHLISDHLGLEMKEDQVCALSTGLYAFIKENNL